jgi:protein-L-isoaspartate(D-aspartate) O-methyltransferase
MQAQAQAVSNVDFATLRRTVVDCQIRPFGVVDQVLLGRFLEVPREIFAPAGQEPLSYSDSELRWPLEGGKGVRPMLLPLVLARLLQAAEIRSGDSVLDVGGATGYTAALVAGLAAHVVAIESDAGLSAAAARNFASLGLSNVEAVCAPLTGGAKGKGAFDVIVVNGAVEEGLEALCGQLSPNGRLVALRPQAAGAARAFIYEREGASISNRDLFEAAGKLLPEFARKPGFSF